MVVVGGGGWWYIVIVSSVYEIGRGKITTTIATTVFLVRREVHPEAQGKGYAQELMQFAENYAIENNYRSIRLDTFSKNTRNQKFYELRNYKKLGNIYFPNQSVYPFYCYERIL